MVGGRCHIVIFPSQEGILSQLTEKYSFMNAQASDFLGVLRVMPVRLTTTSLMPFLSPWMAAHSGMNYLLSTPCIGTVYGIRKSHIIYHNIEPLIMTVYDYHKSHVRKIYHHSPAATRLLVMPYIDFQAC